MEIRTVTGIICTEMKRAAAALRRVAAAHVTRPACAATLSLAAVVGGCTNGGIVIPNLNQPPTADAGVPRNAVLGQRVYLDGLASADPDGDTISYRWSFVDGPTGVLLEDAGTALPSFVPTVNGIYEFALVVDDGRAVVDRDTTLVIVGSTDAEPDCPRADAGSDVTVDEGSGLVTLIGAASTDPGGGALSYAWRQLPSEGAPSITFSDPTVASPSFDAPLVAGDVVLLFELVVTNAAQCGRAATVSVSVRDVPESTACEVDADCRDALFCNGLEACVDGACVAGESPCNEAQVCNEDQDSCDAPGGQNRAPIANAGPDQTAEPGDIVSLDGGNSSDPDNDLLAYLWVQTSGPPVTLAGSDTSTPTFTAPQVDGAEQVVLQLLVSDGALTSEPDEVVVNVLPPGQDDDVRIEGTWTGAADSVRVELGWQFPDGSRPAPTTTDWGTSGMTAVSWPRDSVPAGLHWLTFGFESFSNTTPYFADVRYNVDFLGYSFGFQDNIVTGTARGIALDVSAGEARVVYNAFLPADEPGAGEPTDLPVVEVQVGWRDATGLVRGEVSLQRSGAAPVTGFSSDWGEFGFARIVIPAGTTLADGTYTLTFDLQSISNQETHFADVVYQVRFPSYLFDSPPELRTLSTGTEYTIILEASGGVVTETANGWLD